jgi:PAS domain S-box-containing protein
MTDQNNKDQAVINNLEEFFCRFIPDGTLTYVNQAYCDYFGKTPQELIGKNIKSFIPPEASQPIDQFLSSFTPNRFVRMVEYPVFLPDRRLRWQEWTEYAIFDSAGTLVEFHSVGRDVTELREAEIKYRDREKSLTQLVELSPMGISIHDGDIILFLNQAK